MRGILVIIILVIIGGILTFVQTTDITEQAPETKLTTYSFETLGGSNITIPDAFPEKVLVLNSWASWCGFCVREIPDFAALQSEYPEDVQVIAINRQEPIQDINPFLERINISSNDLLILLDPEDTFFEDIAMELPSMPQTLFVRKDGTISTHERGFMTLEEMRRFTEEALLPPTEE